MASSGEVQPTAPQPSIIDTLRRPSVVLVLLAVWAIVGAIVQLWSDSLLFDLEKQAEGILAGRAFSTSLVIPAIIYLYAARDPQRYRQVFWLALIEQAVAIVSYFYHWGADDIGLEGVILPAAISVGLIFLVFFNLFQPRERLPLPQAPPIPRQ